jgi:hypothetical protein
MQLLLGLAQEPSNQTESSANVWQTLDLERRSQTVAVLARLLAKTAAAGAGVDSAKKRREEDDD